jgi:hypothetical protein
MEIKQPYCEADHSPLSMELPFCSPICLYNMHNDHIILVCFPSI